MANISRLIASQGRDMFPLSSAWTLEARLSSEAGIPQLGDTSVPVINETYADAVCSPLPPTIGQERRYQLQGVVQGLTTSQSGQMGQSRGRGRNQGSQAETLGTQGRVYAITPQTEITYQSVIQGMFLLSRQWQEYCLIPVHLIPLLLHHV